MNRTDTLKRYQLFLNEALDLSLVKKLNSLSPLIKKYGISAGLSKFLIANKIFEKNGDGHYKTNRTDYFDEAATQTLLLEYRRFIHPLKKVTPKVKSKLGEYTTQELFNELKTRGYSGKLYLKKEVEL